MNVVDRVGVSTAGDVGRDNRLVSSIYRSAQSSTPWYDVLDALCEHYDLAKAVSIFSRKGQDRHCMTVDARCGTREAFKPDPDGGADQLKGLAQGEAAFCHVQDSEQTAGSSAPMNLLGIDFFIGEVLAKLRLYRAGGSHFLPSEAVQLQALAFHIAEAMKVAQHVCRLQHNLSFHDMALNRVNVGLIIVASDDQVVWLNQRARRMLAEEDGVRLINNQLRCCWQADTTRLWAAVKSAREDPETTYAASLSRPHGEHDMSVMIIANPQHDGRNDGDPPEVGIFLRDTAQRATMDPKVLKKLFDFTHTEIRLAISLSEGSSLEDAAVDLGIKLATVRVHLRSMFGKVGVHRQSELIRRILV